jgi:hypothetical protein
MLDQLRQYNVVWNSPSKDGSGSMPLGNGDIGVNVWVEQGGELVLLIGKTDAWDENGSNLKLGRVRLKITPNPFVTNPRFQQTLQLPTGDIEIALGQANLLLWVDANQPVIRIEITSFNPVEVVAQLEMWRTEQRTIKTQTSDLFKRLEAPDPYPTIVSPDDVLSEKDRVTWCHHNHKRQNDGYEINMRLQGLGGMLDRMPHPLLARTFGASMEARDFASIDARTLKSTSSTKLELSIYVQTSHPASVDQWRTVLAQTVRDVQRIDRSTARAAHLQWWESFWNRSWIFITGDESATSVTRGYILQRFMNACAGRGPQPIKFNGSIFTVGTPDDPDFRRWGGPGFWFQNQRLVYWSMLASGDFDLMLPWLKMYRDQLELQRHRTRTYFKHAGAHYPETIMFWGAEVSAHYGWTPFEQRKQPNAECTYMTYYWTCGIELSLILWTYWLYRQDDAFAREYLIPIADAVTEFFDLHWLRDSRGKIHFEPAQSLETWHEATNPLPEIAGLRYLLPKLLELPEALTSDAPRTRWRRMLTELPEFPMGERDGKRILLPAEKFSNKKNVENPELYAIFPFRLFGLGKPDLEFARDTFAARMHQSHDCWSQDDIQMALLGLTGQVKANVTARASDHAHTQSRFPAFWDAFHDWIPDMDHGGVLQLALELMLMQTEGREIRLLPAWPKEWNADFKLHAPLQTVIEGKVSGGAFRELRVTPPSRQHDITK